MITQRQQTFFVKGGKGGRADVEPEVNRGRDLVDMLPARALRPHSRQLDLLIRNRDMCGNGEHTVRSMHRVARTYPAAAAESIERRRKQDATCCLVHLPV